MSNIESYVHKGIPLEVIVKVKPEPYQKQDLRIFENKIALLDQYERGELDYNFNILINFYNFSN